MKFKSLLFVILLCACGSHHLSPVAPITPNDTLPIDTIPSVDTETFTGVWYCSDTVVLNGNKWPMQDTLLVDPTNYLMTGYVRFPNAYVKWFIQAGTWNKTDSTVLLSPFFCEKYNASKYVLEKDTCSSTYTAIRRKNNLLINGKEWFRGKS